MGRLGTHNRVTVEEGTAGCIGIHRSVDPTKPHSRPRLSSNLEQRVGVFRAVFFLLQSRYCNRAVRVLKGLVLLGRSKLHCEMGILSGEFIQYGRSDCATKRDFARQYTMGEMITKFARHMALIVLDSAVKVPMEVVA